MQAGFSGEGFRLLTSSGVSYYFDIGVTRVASTLKKTSRNGRLAYLARAQYYILASKIEDRFGNTVQFAYNGAGNPVHIWANDGREITLAYSGNRLVSATSHGRTWQYQYDGAGNLTQVTLPDGANWQYAYAGQLKPRMPLPEEQLLNCSLPPSIIEVAYTLTAKSPSGATANFLFNNTRHGRSGVNINECANTGTLSVPINALQVPNFFDVMSLTQKTISGPGVPTATWSYDYGESPEGEKFWGHLHSSYHYPCTTCRLDKTIYVSEPDGTKRRYKFGYEYAFNDGRQLQLEILSADGSVIRSQTDEYMSESSASTQPFYPEYGILLGGVGDPATPHIRPIVDSYIRQDGATFINSINSFDIYARVVQQTKSSGMGYSRVDQTTYSDNTDKWVLGQVAERKVNGTTESLTGFDGATALPLTFSSFGKMKQTLTWNADGTIATVADGKNQVTTASNWKRGIPQLIGHADGTNESAVVNDAGWITSVKDANAHTTNYGYDTMGRLTSIDYPTGDEVAWNQMLLSFGPVGGSEFGIPGGHWKQTVQTGNSYSVTYFDAMWRPLVEEHYDSANKAATLSQSVQRYDNVGHKVFASYPINNLGDYAAANLGSYTSYDALNRVTQVQQNSEVGTLTSTTAYLPGFKTAVTDPKGNVTTTAFMAFDQPTTDWPVSITAPENITQTIVRDVFGSPTSLTQSGLYGTESNSVTKTMTYDSNHQLCRTTEPESGSEVMAWDAAGNLQWSAAGLAITGTDCGLEQVSAEARTSRTYDVMNRVKLIQPPAGTQSSSYDYDPLGRMTSATSSSMSGTNTWYGTYNFRGMLTGESLQLSGRNALAVGYAHDANGHTSLVHYPDGENVSYAPDALGRPTQVGNYANSISYFPNGEVSQFLFGNGAVYVAEQNARQLLSNFTYGTGGTPRVSEDLTYDQSGNITVVNDLADGPRTKSFGYDGLDRLTGASGLWGNQVITYDALNNLRTLQTGGQTSVYHYDPDNKLASISGIMPVSFGYDTRGNVTTKNATNLVFDQKDSSPRSWAKIPIHMTPLGAA